MFDGAHDFLIQGGKFTVEQNGRTGLQLLHHKMTHGATHDSAERYPPPRCHPDTRKTIVGEITDWIEDRSRTSSVVWVNGPAGAGKTAIAQTICENCKKSGQLAGSFFFSRTVHGRNNPRYLFATIAYQLAIAIPEVGDRIENAITNDPSIIDKSMELQLQRLIMEPLQALDLSARPTVIVIDGLDECEGENMQCHILQLLGSVFGHGIIPVCFIVGSRPEPWIRDEFNSGLLHRNTRRISLEQSEEANEDILTFFLAGFSDIHNSPKYRQTMEGVSKTWPSDDVINDLVERASGQFIYPSTVLKFVGDPNYRPADRLEMVLSIPVVKSRKSNPLAELDRLYSQILSTCPEVSHTLTVLGSIVAMRVTGAKLCLEWSPQIDSLKIIEKLIGLHPGDAYLALRTIRSLVKVSSLDNSSDDLAPDEHQGCIDSEDAVIFYHKSFVDFLLDDTRSGDYSVDFKSINASLALGCMNIMKTLSLIPATRINYITWGYAVLHWTEHCILSGHPRESLVDSLRSLDLKSYLDTLPKYQLSKECEDAISRLAFSEPVIFQKSSAKLINPMVPNPSDIERAVNFFISTGAQNDTIMFSYGARLKPLAQWLEKSPKVPRKLLEQYHVTSNILSYYSRRASRRPPDKNKAFKEGIPSQLKYTLTSILTSFWGPQVWKFFNHRS